MRLACEPAGFARTVHDVVAATSESSVPDNCTTDFHATDWSGPAFAVSAGARATYVTSLVEDAPSSSETVNVNVNEPGSSSLNVAACDVAPVTTAALPAGRSVTTQRYETIEPSGSSDAEPSSMTVAPANAVPPLPALASGAALTSLSGTSSGTSCFEPGPHDASKARTRRSRRGIVETAYRSSLSRSWRGRLRRGSNRLTDMRPIVLRS